jgi:hypothetical protein
MDLVFTKLWSEFGLLALGWCVAALLGTRILRQSTADRLTPKDYKDLIKAYHDAIVDNTKVTERLALLIEDRTRQQLNGNAK